MKNKQRFLIIWIEAGVLCLGALQGLAQVPAERRVDYYHGGDSQLEDSVLTALERNPMLQEKWSAYRAALQKIPQVTSLPDPMVQFTQFLRSAETRVGPQLNSIMVSQKFPWFGKLDLQGQMAFNEAAALLEAYRAQERELIVQVKRAYYDLGYLAQALRITQEEELLLDYYEELAQSRYASGQGLQQSVIKIQAEITRNENRFEMFSRQRQSAGARLNTLLDRAPETPVAVTGPFSLPRFAMPLEALYRLGEQNRQELKAVLTRIEKNRQSMELAKRSYWPDVTVSAGMVNVGGRDDPAGRLMPPPDNGKNTYHLSFGINIPLQRDRYDAAVLEAVEKTAAQRQKYAGILNEMEFAIRDQVVRLETLQEQVELFEEVLIPQTEEALRSTEAAYETGQVGALDLLDSERMLLDVRLINARYRADFMRALAELERALGTRFPR